MERERRRKTERELEIERLKENIREIDRNRKRDKYDKIYIKKNWKIERERDEKSERKIKRERERGFFTNKKKREE